MDTPPIDISALGRLARLEFPADEGQRYTGQLPRLVDYVGQLQSIETDVVAESQPAVSMRPDEAAASPARNEILAAAPEREGDYWKVKTVF